MTSESLGARLLEIRAGGYAAPPDAWELTLAMLRPANLGHRDPELRDELIYRTLASWIHGRAFSPEQLRAILATVVDEHHLFFQLGASGGESVLTRSSSVLQVAAVLGAHSNGPSLEPGRMARMSASPPRWRWRWAERN